MPKRPPFEGQPRKNQRQSLGTAHRGVSAALALNTSERTVTLSDYQALVIDLIWPRYQVTWPFVC